MKRVCVLRWPTLEGGHGEERHHGHEHIVEVEVAVVPLTFLDGGMIHVSVFVHDERTPGCRRERERFTTLITLLFLESVIIH